MNAVLVEEWSQFCRGESPRFTGNEGELLKACKSREDLAVVLQHVPGNDLLEPRLARLLGLELPPRIEGGERFEELEKVAVRALLEWRRVVEAVYAKRLVKRLDGLSLRWVAAKKRPARSSVSWAELDSHLSDYIRTSYQGVILGDDGKLVPSVAVLMSGTYLLASDWDMVRYLLEPWTGAPYDPEPMQILRDNGLRLVLASKEARLVYPPEDADGASARAKTPVQAFAEWPASVPTPAKKKKPKRRAAKRTMDQTLLREWREFCKRPSRAEFDAFYTLFMEPISPAELEEVFEHVPKGEAIAPRLGQIKTPGPVVPPIVGPDRRKELEKLLAADIAEKAKVVGGAGHDSMATELVDPRVTWGTREDVYAAREKASDFNADVVSIVSDHCRQALTEDGWLVSALTEAIYGATTDYDMVWYVLAPWLETDYDPEPAFLLREHGVMRVFTPSGVVATDLVTPRADS